jgi:hypothetical protein
MQSWPGHVACSCRDTLLSITQQCTTVPWVALEHHHVQAQNESRVLTDFSPWHAWSRGCIDSNVQHLPLTTHKSLLTWKYVLTYCSSVLHRIVSVYSIRKTHCGPFYQHWLQLLSNCQIIFYLGIDWYNHINVLLYYFTYFFLEKILNICWCYSSPPP